MALGCAFHPVGVFGPSDRVVQRGGFEKRISSQTLPGAFLSPDSGHVVYRNPVGASVGRSTALV